MPPAQIAGQVDQDDDANGVKFTGRFDIQIENEKDFQVARRLIGAKGCNMKRIIEVCSKNAPRGMQNDIVKLRLRGKGSGFKEGPRQEESKEPIHLCISSKFLDKYQLACTMAHDLLTNVYEEYKRYSEKSKKVLRIVDPQAVIVNNLIQVKKSEIVTGRKPSNQSQNTYVSNPQTAPTHNSYGNQQNPTSAGQ